MNIYFLKIYCKISDPQTVVLIPIGVMVPKKSVIFEHNWETDLELGH